MIELGVNVPNFGPATTPASLRAWVEFAEEVGFSVAMMSDHVALTADVAAIYPPPFYDPFTILSWLSGFATRVTLGTSVAILPYRHPLLTARLGANLHQITDGRFVLGVGVGWSEPEYDALGVSFADRGRITDEYLEVITRAWTDEIETTPRLRARPPIWVGGAGLTAIKRAARFGDAWHPVNPERERLEQGLPVLADAAASFGRPTPSLNPRIKARLTSQDVIDADRPLGLGSLAQVRDDLAWLDELGAGVVVLDTNPDHPDQRQPAADDWRTLQQIAEAAAPFVELR